jgi:hypothetical protein
MQSEITDYQNEPLTLVRQLQSLIIEESLNLDRIRMQLNEFNPFDVLGIQHFEIRHSNFLSWMFNPLGNHNCGDYFLKGFISGLEIFSAADKIRIFLSKLTSTRVYREWNNIDILIINDDLKFAIAIENKIWANKGDNEQLLRYAKLIRSLYADSNDLDYIICPVYLTPFNRMLSDDELKENYQNVLYKEVVALLKKTICDVEPERPVEEFINYYIDNITKRIMNDDKNELNILAHRIYRQHKAAIDFIISKKPVIYSDVNFKTITIFLEQNDIYKLLPSNDFIVRFLPKSVEELFVNEAFRSWEFEHIFCIEIFLNEQTLRVKFCAGAVNNDEESIKLQGIKNQYFEEMRKFTSLRTICKKSRPSTGYPAVAEKDILSTEDDLFYDAEDFAAAFIQSFAKFEQQFLDPWTQEVLAKQKLLFS